MNDLTFETDTTRPPAGFPRRGLFRAAAAGLAVGALGGADGPPAAAPPPAKPEDVNSPAAVLAALYDVISGPQGKARDWDRFRSLFVPGARLIPCVPKDGGKSFATRVLTPDEFAASASKAVEKSGFYEREVARKADRFGHVAQVFSTYESRREPGAEPFARGINSIQLFWDGGRWWVVTVYWDQEGPGQPIPPEYRAKS